ncbi:hypothetical protein M378DRAFT_105956 [Amanita muscaria Koide BX008]|uniref:Uncharacterized protein n=1 Tax=Amanita muscaria (strain Koide BX008) TaxID=946122 RepID=A0A0C2TCT5_AMAMK|nr:hypothetical protein M378DRAFT_105956 [Amanita muscaria Koide BX008]
MNFRACLKPTVLLAYLASYANGQTSWCGKNYRPNQPIVLPGGQFSFPPASTNPLLALRCAQTIRPYVAAEELDSSQPVSILIDTPVTYSFIDNANPITIPDLVHAGFLDVTVSTDGQILTRGAVPLNATKHELPFSLAALQPRTAAYNITCTASRANLLLWYTGDEPDGTSDPLDATLKTNNLIVSLDGGDGTGGAGYHPVSLVLNCENYYFTYVKSGVHPIPDFGNITVLEQVLDAMQEAGLYLMYDMRHDYMNASSIVEQVDLIKSRANLLLWYTGDEPDGTSDPLDATLKANNLIVSLDGGDGTGGAGYHPVSLVLNCENYYFTQYSSGADIVMQDAYMIGNNVTYSTEYQTACTPDYGCCGCDNCKGSFEDISTRMDEFYERFLVNGWERTKTVWTVPQGFGNSQFWTREPTGKEFVVESVLAINHGALGVVSWNDPTTSEIKAYASLLAKSLKDMTRFIFDPSATFHHVSVLRVDVGMWTVGSETLVLATNLNYEPRNVALKDLGFDISQATVTQVLNSGAVVLGAHGSDNDMVNRNAEFSFESTGTGGFIIMQASLLDVHSQLLPAPDTCFVLPDIILLAAQARIHPV